MTKKKALPNSAALSDLEATPEMIEAGVHVLQNSGRLEYEAPGPDELLVTAIFREMELKRQSSVKDPPT